MISISDNDGQLLREINEKAEDKYTAYKRKTIEWIGEMKRSFDTCELKNSNCPGRITLSKFEKEVC